LNDFYDNNRGEAMSQAANDFKKTFSWDTIINAITA